MDRVPPIYTLDGVQAPVLSELPRRRHRTFNRSLRNTRRGFDPGLVAPALKLARFTSPSERAPDATSENARSIAVLLLTFALAIVSYNV